MSVLKLDIKQAFRLAALPLAGIDREYPNAPGIVHNSARDIAPHREHHPAFYGCFDWHSSVHGHWMLIKLLREFSGLRTEREIRAKLGKNLTAANIGREKAYLENNRSFERTYGWAWLLKLHGELLEWDDPDGREWRAALQPLADLIRELYKEYLPKLDHPIRSGEHPNTAFGLIFAWEYAKQVGDDALAELIATRAIIYYKNDRDCPLNWEPSGYDFFSPCLMEADLMRRILPPAEFSNWFAELLPKIDLTPAQVTDRSDGKMVHLDGLNFSRAWCLYGLAEHTKNRQTLLKIADNHLNYSLPNIVDGDYAGEHWLASFALLTLTTRRCADA